MEDPASQEAVLLYFTLNFAGTH